VRPVNTPLLSVISWFNGVRGSKRIRHGALEAPGVGDEARTRDPTSQVDPNSEYARTRNRPRGAHFHAGSMLFDEE
jgi:hypothetical protein